MNYRQNRKQNWYRTSIVLTSRKTELATSAWEPRLQGLLAEKRIDTVVLRAGNFEDLITADHKVLGEGCESRNDHRYAVVAQELTTQWAQSYPCKTKTSRETKKSVQKFLEPTDKSNVINTDNSLEFGKSCEDLSWNHCTSTSHRRVKDGTSAVLLPTKDDSDKHVKNQWFLLSNGWVSPDFNTRSLKNCAYWDKKVLPCIFLCCALIAGGIWKGDILITNTKEPEMIDASQFYPQRINATEVLITQKGDEFRFPVTDGTVKVSGRDYEFREVARRREQNVGSEDLSGEFQDESEESQPTKLKDDAEVRKDFWTIQGDFILSSSRWISSSSSCWKKKHSYSTEIHWCNLVHAHWSGCDARKACWGILERRFEQKFVRFLVRFTKLTLLKKKTFKRIHVSGAETDKKFNSLRNQIMYGQKFGRKLVKSFRIERNGNGQKKNRSSTKLEDWNGFTLSILMTKNTKKRSNIRRENWKDLWHQLSSAKRSPKSIRETCVNHVTTKNRTVHERRIPNRCSVL